MFEWFRLLFEPTRARVAKKLPVSEFRDPGTEDSDPGKTFFAGANWEQAGFMVQDNTFSFPSSCQLILQVHPEC